MRIYRGERAFLVKSSRYPRGRLSYHPFKLGKMRLRIPFPFTTSRKIAEEFAQSTGGAHDEAGDIPILIVADAKKIKKTINWDWEREVLPIGVFEVKSIEVLE